MVLAPALVEGRSFTATDSAAALPIGAPSYRVPPAWRLFPKGSLLPHDTSLLAMLVMGLVLAFIGGFIASRLKLPPLVGYLLAGVAVGPFTPGFVGDAALANQLAEIGVILLMFGVGLHFSIKDLRSEEHTSELQSLMRISY